MARTKKKHRKIVSGGQVNRLPDQTIILQPPHRGGLDVSYYMNSIRSAEHIDFPRRSRLIDLYEDVKIDSHLFAVLRKQKAAILSSEIQFTRDGDVDEKIQEHIESPWFRRFISDIIDDAWIGVGGSLFQFYRDEKGWINYELVDRKHVDADKRMIITHQEGMIGESWDEFGDLLYIGSPRQIGDLAVAAFWVILKRNNVADWAELAEIFGRPIREGVYNAWDEKAREKLIEDIYNMGGAGVIVHPDGTKINLIKADNASGSGDLYEKFSTFCNNEISKAVNGNTLTTEAGDKGTQALGTVQKDGEKDIIFFIQQRILDILNYEVTDVFQAMGINTDGGKFSFVPEKNKDLTARIAIDCKLKNEIGLIIDDEYFYEEYGIPKPDNYDELKAQQEEAKKAAAQALENEPEPEPEPDDDEPDDDPDDDDTPDDPKPKTKKQQKGIINALRSFFSAAPESDGADLDW